MKNLFLLHFILLSFTLAGQDYFQQKADYNINVTLDDENHTLQGNIYIDYFNNSPNDLEFIWFHIWPNAYKDNTTALAKQKLEDGSTSLYYADEQERGYINNLDFKVENKKVHWDYHPQHIDICKVYLNKPLRAGQSLKISTPFFVKIPDGKFSRLGHVEQSYMITQWYPKPAVYDKDGWHPMPYLDQGEFYSEFGSFDVSITLPSNYTVGATGDLQNYEEIERLEKLAQITDTISKFSDDMSFPNSNTDTKTLRYIQSNIHDFGWFADKRYHVLRGEVELPKSKEKVTLWTMFTNNEADLWKNSIEYMHDAVYYYSLWNGDYPYKHCSAVDGTISAGGGMEYPNITVIGESGDAFLLEEVIMHEVGHNWFYGMLGSNERDHPWMDEGINTFLQFQAERRWSEDYPVRRGDPDLIANYMVSTNQVPIMTQSDSIPQFGNNAYGKPATALVVLRETVLGRELFDRAFQEYAERWRFKRPTPYDFFRTMEESSGVDLDWFWRGWFYSTDHVDIAITSVTEGTVNTENPEIENDLERQREADASNSTTLQNNIDEGIVFYEDENPETQDFYSANDPHIVTNRQREAYESLRDSDLPEHEVAALDFDGYVYFVNLENQGGVVMPVILEFTFADGGTDEVRIPAEIWRFNPDSAIWRYITDKQVVSVELDPHLETADADRTDNYYPPQIQPSRLEVYRNTSSPSSLMDDMDLRVERDSIQTRDQ